MSIEVKNVSFSYPNGFQALNEINLTIQERERVAIVGQNGAGKTTCVKLMNGIYRPSEGDVFVDGINTKTKTNAFIARLVGYVFQNSDDQIFNNTVKTELEFMPKYLKLTETEINQRVTHAVKLTHIEKYLKTNPYEIPYPIRKFIAIAAVIATQPKYIILDEPTAGQDQRGINTLSTLIRALEEENITVITITHDMEFVANNFNRVVAMAHKNIIADGTARDIFWNDNVIAQSRIRKPQIGELAKILQIDGDILFTHELVGRL